MRLIPSVSNATRSRAGLPPVPGDVKAEALGLNGRLLDRRDWTNRDVPETGTSGFRAWFGGFLDRAPLVLGVS